MQQPDLIIKNGMILTMDNNNSIIENGYLCVNGNSITQVGSDDNNFFKAAVTVDAKGGIILPGLINGHTHASMTLFRGLADDLPLMEWLNDYIFPVESRMDADFVYAGAMLACAEMIMSGTTTFCDMYLFENEVARAAVESGMRCVVGEALYDFDSPNYGPVKQGLVYAEKLIKTWQSNPLVNISVDPHSLFTCSPELLLAANELALTYQVPLVIHVAETLTELQEVKRRYGRGPVRHLEKLGLLGPHLVAVHCVHLNESDIKLLAEHKVSVIHNPESNMKLASGVSPAPELMAEGVTVGIGTDGCASNNNLDMFSEIDMTAKLHKLNAMDPTAMSALTVLRMATVEGARALGIDKITGSLEPGKKADIIVVDTHKPHLAPMYNPCSNLVYSATGSDVIHTIIDGRVIMNDRELVTLDPDATIAHAKEMAKRVSSWLFKKRADA
jgi:5-methylthioadenosine/S-adenosylhomocysteine deaminase